GLVAVQRTVAGGVEPERALALPHLQAVRGLAGPAAFVAGPARTIILRPYQIRAEAETLIGQCDRPVRIAFPGSDAVAEPGDEDIAHHDLGGEALRRLGARGDLDGGDGGAAITRPQIDGFRAIEGGGLRPVAVVERPGAGGAHRDLAGQPNRDRVIDRRQIAFLDVVAGAGLADAAEQVDAEAVHRVARPAAAVALQFKRLLGGQHAAAAPAVGMEQEIAFLAE